MIQQGQTFSFKLARYSYLSSNVLKMALYDGNANLTLSGTTVYTTDNEITGTGYTAGGEICSNVAVSQGEDGIVYVNFDPVVWASATFTARGALVYDTSDSNSSVAILNFGSDKTVVNQTFTVTLPANTSTSAIIRID